MAGLDLASILGQIGDLQSVLRGDQKQVEKTVEQNQALRSEQINAATSMIGNTVEQARIEGDQKLRMEERKAATARAFGTDILDPDNRLAYLASEQAAALDDAIANSKRAAELRDTTLFSNPLEYLVNRPFATRNDDAAAAAKIRADIIDKGIDDLNTQSQSTIQTQAAINQTFTAEQQKLQLEAVAATAADKVRQLQLQQNTQYLNELKVLREVPIEVIRQGVTGYNLQATAEQRALVLEESRLNREARLAAKKTEAKSASEQMAIFNAGAKLMGKQQYTDPVQFAEMLKTKVGSAVAGPIMNVGLSALVDQQYSVENKVQIQPAISRNTGEALRLLADTRGQLAPSAERTASSMGTLFNSTKAELLRNDKDGKLTPDQVVTAVNEKLYGKVVPNKDPKKQGEKVPGLIEVMQANMDADISGGQIKNIYRAPAAAVIADLRPDLTVEPFWKALVVPATNLSPAPSADQLYKQAKIAVANKTLTVDQAAEGIATYYKVATLANNANEQYQLLGIPMQKSYVATIDTERGLFGGKTLKTMDTLDVQKIKHELVLGTMYPIWNDQYKTKGAK